MWDSIKLLSDSFFQYIYEIVSGNKSFFYLLNWGKKWQLTVKMKTGVSNIKVSTGANRVLLCTPVVKKGLGFFALKAFLTSTS